MPSILYKIAEIENWKSWINVFNLLFKVNVVSQTEIHDIYDFQDFKNYYGELRGATLFLYKDDTQDTVNNIFTLPRFAKSWFTNYKNDWLIKQWKKPVFPRKDVKNYDKDVECWDKWRQKLNHYIIWD